MKTNILRWWFLICIGFVLILPALTFSQVKNSEIQQALQKLKEKAGEKFSVKWHGDGRVKTIEGKLSFPYQGTPENAAKQFLKENAAIFQMAPDLHDIEVEYIKESLIGTHLTFQQSYRRLPVFNGGVDIHITGAGEVFLIHNRYIPETALSQLSLTPSLSKDEAAKLAVDDYPAHKLSDKLGKFFLPEAALVTAPPELGIFRISTGNRLVYRLRVGVVRYIIDAHSGKTLERTELIQFIDGTGQVFDPNPVNTLNNTTLQDNGDQNYPALSGAYFTRTLRDITQTGTGSSARFKLEGPFVKAKNILSFLNPIDPCFNILIPVWKSPPVKRDTNFVFTRDQSGFEHVMTYFQLDTNQRYIQSLEFLNINNRPINVDAHAMRADNSFYCASPIGSGYLAFGDGGVDDAEDADVILHEYGHSIQDNQSNGRYLGCSTEAGAMGEGFGDYWAASNTYNISTANGFDPACIAEWDAAPNCLRRVDSTKHYPEAIVKECHADGEIWSGALWDMFNTLGRTTTDKLVLQSHFLVPDNPTFCDGAKAILQADAQLYGGANKNTIISIMENRGIGNYTVKDLGTFGGNTSGAIGINDSGQVVGYSYMPDWTTHAFLWDAINGMQDLGTLGGTYSYAYGINDSGQVVGWAERADGYGHAVLWQTCVLQ